MKKMKELFKKNSFLVIIVSIVIFLIILMCVFWIKKGTFSLLEGEDQVALECAVSGQNEGDIFNCQVLLYSPNTTTLSVNANYEFSDNLSYTEFVTSECTEFEYCFEEFANSANGFALGNLDGYNHPSRPLLLGTLTVTLKEDLASIDDLQIKLTNVELSDSNFEMHALDDVIADIHAVSDDATISGGAIYLRNCLLTDDYCDALEYVAPTINDLNDTYEFTVPSEAISASFMIETTDNNATIKSNDVLFIKNIDCDLDDDCNNPHRGYASFSLHYGTNIIPVTVTAEDGITTKQYTFFINREYDFATEVYDYDSHANFIYTGFDTGDAIIDNLEFAEEGISYNINNNKLEVLFNNELLLSIDIFNFETDYTVTDGKIFVDNGVIYGELLDHFNSANLTFVVTDGDENEITNFDAEIGNGYNFNVYDENLLDSFEFVVGEKIDIDDEPSDNNDGDLVIDEPSRLIKHISVGSDVAWLKTKFNTTGEVYVLDGETEEDLEEDDVLKTGDIVLIVFDDEYAIRYTLSVLGDVSGDGQILINDVAFLYAHLKGRRTDENALSRAAIEAGDIDGNNEILINDVAKIYQRVKGVEGAFGD